MTNEDRRPAVSSDDNSGDVSSSSGGVALGNQAAQDEVQAGSGTNAGSPSVSETEQGQSGDGFSPKDAPEGSNILRQNCGQGGAEVGEAPESEADTGTQSVEPDPEKIIEGLKQACAEIDRTVPGGNHYFRLKAPDLSRPYYVMISNEHFGKLWGIKDE